MPDPPALCARLGHVALKRGPVPMLPRGTLDDSGAARLRRSGDGHADSVPDVPTVHDHAVS
eukprot:779706-Prymnesium_polylepis.1